MGRGSRQGLQDAAAVDVRGLLDARRDVGRGAAGWHADAYKAATVEELAEHVTAMLEAQDPFARHLNRSGSQGRLANDLDGRTAGTPYVTLTWRTERGTQGTPGLYEHLNALLEGRQLSAGEPRLWSTGIREHDDHAIRIYPGAWP